MERKFIDRNFAIPAGIRHGIIGTYTYLFSSLFGKGWLDLCGKGFRTIVENELLTRTSRV